MSTTSEDFKLYAHPDYQRILPDCVDELECRYPAGFSFSRLRFGEMRVPKASGERGTWSRCATPAQPGMVLGSWDLRKAPVTSRVLGCWESQGKLHP